MITWIISKEEELAFATKIVLTMVLSILAINANMQINGKTAATKNQCLNFENYKG